MIDKLITELEEDTMLRESAIVYKLTSSWSSIGVWFNNVSLAINLRKPCNIEYELYKGGDMDSKERIFSGTTVVRDKNLLKAMIKKTILQLSE